MVRLRKDLFCQAAFLIFPQSSDLDLSLIFAFFPHRSLCAMSLFVLLTGCFPPYIVIDEI